MDAWIVIIGILFWVVTALAVIGILGYVFLCIQYYRWDKLEREEEKLAQAVSVAVADTISENETK